MKDSTFDDKMVSFEMYLFHLFSSSVAGDCIGVNNTLSTGISVPLRKVKSYDGFPS